MHQPNIPPRSKNRSSSSKRPSTSSKVLGVNQIQQQRKVTQLPQHNSDPVWLKSLLTLQQGSLVLFCSIFGLSSIVYGYTVYTQDMWKSQHSQLRRLQKQERQQGVMDENLKQQMAKTAEQPGSGFVAPSPDKIVFIPTAPPRPTKSIPAPPSPQPTPASQFPVGY
ncbi:hypothetical protein [Chamaesiphon sp. VAR_48_metabat_135_sub]|uniref:hypothetical protein n=1 Tax=Chamaesiphon sp. VAR_48_metabat_135_sub TaxID=2964699 RepID=UPI00286BE4C8|nr:hypothetical protein [Chamaesiphon sp. VAR_48_metabat_135_sub]